MLKATVFSIVLCMQSFRFNNDDIEIDQNFASLLYFGAHKTLLKKIIRNINLLIFRFVQQNKTKQNNSLLKYLFDRNTDLVYLGITV